MKRVEDDEKIFKIWITYSKEKGVVFMPGGNKKAEGGPRNNVHELLIDIKHCLYRGHNREYLKRVDKSGEHAPRFRTLDKFKDDLEKDLKGILTVALTKNHDPEQKSHWVDAYPRDPDAPDDLDEAPVGAQMNGTILEQEHVHLVVDADGCWDDLVPDSESDSMTP